MWYYKVHGYNECEKNMHANENLMRADTAQKVKEYLHAYYGDSNLVKVAAIEKNDFECHILPFEKFDANWATIKEENF